MDRAQLKKSYDHDALERLKWRSAPELAVSTLHTAEHNVAVFGLRDVGTPSLYILVSFRVTGYIIDGMIPILVCSGIPSPIEIWYSCFGLRRRICCCCDADLRACA